MLLMKKRLTGRWTSSFIPFDAAIISYDPNLKTLRWLTFQFARLVGVNKA